MANDMLKVPDLEALRKYEVNRRGAQEVIRQTLYDFQTYAAAGQSTLSFFQVPAGQSGKTLEDTNVELAGSLPSPKRLLVESIEIYFFPGVDPHAVGSSANTTVAEEQFANDVYTVAKNGFLRFFIGSKDYLVEGPLNRFPSKTCLKTDFAAAVHFSQTTAADAQRNIQSNYAVMYGRPYRLQPPILIPPTQNFRVTLEWPNGVQALPSGVDGRIGVVMDGLLYRLSQ